MKIAPLIKVVIQKYVGIVFLLTSPVLLFSMKTPRPNLPESLKAIAVAHSHAWGSIDLQDLDGKELVEGALCNGDTNALRQLIDHDLNYLDGLTGHEKSSTLTLKEKSDIREKLYYFFYRKSQSASDEYKVLITGYLGRLVGVAKKLQDPWVTYKFSDYISLLYQLNSNLLPSRFIDYTTQPEITELIETSPDDFDPIKEWETAIEKSDIRAVVYIDSLVAACIPPGSLPDLAISSRKKLFFGKAYEAYLWQCCKHENKLVIAAKDILEFFAKNLQKNGIHSDDWIYLRTYSADSPYIIPYILQTIKFFQEKGDDSPIFWYNAQQYDDTYGPLIAEHKKNRDLSAKINLTQQDIIEVTVKATNKPSCYVYGFRLEQKEQKIRLPSSLKKNTIDAIIMQKFLIPQLIASQYRVEGYPKGEFCAGDLRGPSLELEANVIPEKEFCFPLPIDFLDLKEWGEI